MIWVGTNKVTISGMGKRRFPDILIGDIAIDTGVWDVKNYPENWVEDKLDLISGTRVVSASDLIDHEDVEFMLVDRRLGKNTTDIQCVGFERTIVENESILHAVGKDGNIIPVNDSTACFVQPDVELVRSEANESMTKDIWKMAREYICRDIWSGTVDRSIIDLNNYYLQDIRKASVIRKINGGVLSIHQTPLYNDDSHLNYVILFREHGRQLSGCKVLGYHINKSSCELNFNNLLQRYENISENTSKINFDNQRSRLYALERELEKMFLHQGSTCILPDERSDQELAGHLWEFLPDTTKGPPDVKSARRDSRVSSYTKYGHTIRIVGGLRTKLTLLHELAHAYIANNKVFKEEGASHDKTFAAVSAALYEIFMSQPIELYAELAIKHNVEVDFELAKGFAAKIRQNIESIKNVDTNLSMK